MMGVIGLRGPGAGGLLGTPRTDQEKKKKNNVGRYRNTHTPYNIPYTHTHNTPVHTHTTHIQPPQHPLGTPTHGSTIADVGVKQADESLGLTPPHVQGQLKHSRVHAHSHRKNNRKGSAKAQTYKHHIRHTPNTHNTHTRHTVSEGFTFTHPGQGMTNIHGDGLINLRNHPLPVSCTPTSLGSGKSYQYRGTVKKGSRSNKVDNMDGPRSRRLDTRVGPIPE